MMKLTPPPEDKQAELMEKVKAAVKVVDEVWLAKPGFVAGGSHPTIADLHLLSEVEQLRMVASKFDFAPYHNVQRFRELMSKQPLFNEVFGGLIAFTSKP